MVLFETNAVYGAIVDEVYVRDVSIALADDEVAATIDDARRPLWVTGLAYGDFAVFLCLIDHEGAEEIPYLVSHVDDDTAIVVPAELIEHEVRTYGTLELSRRLRGIDPDELAQFGIGSLTKALFDRFPGSDF